VQAELVEHLAIPPHHLLTQDPMEPMVNHLPLEHVRPTLDWADELVHTTHRGTLSHTPVAERQETATLAGPANGLAVPISASTTQVADLVVALVE
jgi:hypothetical protein